MDGELKKIKDFLAQHPPFDLLPEDVLDRVAGTIEIGVVAKGTVVLEPGQACGFLYLIHNGAVETRSPENHLLARLSEGELFGMHALMTEGHALNRVTSLEECRFYKLPANEFESLKNEFPQFAYFFAPLGIDRLRDAETHRPKHSEDQLKQMSCRIGDLLKRSTAVTDCSSTVQEAAEIMSANHASSILIMHDGKLVGILTDRDIRSRVVAAGADLKSPVCDFMTHNPVTLDADSLAFDAQLAMIRGNIKHLPITRNGQVAGVLTNFDLMQQETISAVYMVGEIYKRSEPADLAEVVSRIPQLLMHLVEAGTTAHNLGHIITSIADAATVRLLQLAEAKLGPAPVPYLWLAAGSQARQEQTGLSDQDNSLILDDSFNEAEHGAYFEALARFVNDGLNACGYVYCPGEMMAITPKWRQPLAQWKKYFSGWIEQPEPMALMLSCIFFDLRPIHGDFRLYDELLGMILEKAKGNKIFIALMVGNAMQHTPPLGFFRNFVLIRGGEHDHQFDLKHSGVVPIVDVARIYALEAGIAAVNTHDRLVAVQGAHLLSESGARDLIDAHEFIASTRLKHQAAQIRAGQKPDNFVSPKDLSHFERNHLKDAFSAVKLIQSSLASSFQPR